MKLRYRLTVVTTKDYGDSVSAGKMVSGTLARIPDGTPWHQTPSTIEIGVPEGTRPGAIYTVIIEEESSES